MSSTWVTNYDYDIGTEGRLATYMPHCTATQTDLMKTNPYFSQSSRKLRKKFTTTFGAI